MPPLPTLHAEALADLETQLRFAPRDALLRDIARAEALAADVEPEQAYPIEWVVFRITGYRPDHGSAAIRGEDLLADLSALVERLCAGACLAAESLEPGRFLTIEELARRWSVSRSTINRHRKRGLVARRVREASGTSRLAFSVEVVERHEARYGEALARAGAYSRIGPQLERRMLARARRYAARTDLSLNEAAARIARRYDRSHEGVRQLLRRHAGDGGLFDERGPPTARERRLIHRASLRAIEARDIASRLGRSIGAIRRALDEQRASVLAAIDRSGALEVPDAIERLARNEAWVAAALEATEARRGLVEDAPRDLLALITWAREAEAWDDRALRARLLAYHALRARAAHRIRSLRSGTPSPRSLDRAETDIRWAALLKLRIGGILAPAVLREIETTLDTPLDRLRPAEAASVINAAIRGAGVVIDTHDPTGPAPIAAPLALEASGAASRIGRARAGAGRATPRVAGGVELAPWIDLLAPRFAVLAPDGRLARGLDALGPEQRSALDERFGLTGSAPSTLDEIAERRAVRPMHVARLLRRAQRAAMAAVRSG